jgi:outer membrane protein assembly factor BamB
VLSGDLVIITGGNTKPSLLAYKQSTGELAWTAGDDGSSYSTPVLMTLAGVPQIVVVNQGSVTGHDPATGTVLWRFDWPATMQSPKSAQPIQASDDSFLVTSSYGVKGHLVKVTKGSDGKLAAASVWQTSQMRTKFSSVSVLGGYAYGLDEGTLACIDMKTGERVWRGGRYGYGQHILLGDVMLMQAERGDVVLIKLQPGALNEIARLPALSSKTWNPPTLAGRWLLVRNDREMVCYELK